MKTEEMKGYVERAKRGAKYIDEILEAINKKEYLYIGFNGTDRIYCYTKCLPMGPTFVQDPDNFKEENFFTKSFKEDLNKAEVIVFSSCDIAIKDEITNKLNSEFTTTPPEIINSIQKPADFYYTIYFKK